MKIKKLWKTTKYVALDEFITQFAMGLKGYLSCSKRFTSVNYNLDCHESYPLACDETYFYFSATVTRETKLPCNISIAILEKGNSFYYENKP